METDFIINTEIKNKLEKGCRRTQQKLFKHLHKKLFVTCLRYAKDQNQASDFFQTGMIKIFSNIDKFVPEKSKIETWGNRVIINSILDFFRTQSHKREFEVYDEHSLEIYNEKFEELSPTEIIKILQELPDKYRLIFNLRVFEEKSYKEIYELTKININTAKSIFQKSRKLLNEIIKDLNI